MRIPDRYTVVRASLLAGTLSGAPSSAHAVVADRSVSASTRAAGTLLGRPTVPRGALAHSVVTVWWTTVLVAVLPRRHTVVAGAAAGLAIGLLDLGIARLRYPDIATLPTRPQLLDHVAFGLLVGAVAAPALRATAPSTDQRATDQRATDRRATGQRTIGNGSSSTSTR
ncbi:MAG: hypothetical protein ABW328_22355 [Ilumatobacteraceae bacterium]